MWNFAIFLFINMRSFQKRRNGFSNIQSFFKLSEICKPTKGYEFVSDFHHFDFVVNILNHPFPWVGAFPFLYTIYFAVLINNFDNRALSVCSASSIEHDANVYAVVPDF